ncbi:MAG: hypothetical protein JOZ57_10220 [Abitibacteriaceae bacterium]|nr:hypothetical protein [Abditibacteriaceae bacterium]
MDRAKSERVTALHRKSVQVLVESNAQLTAAGVIAVPAFITHSFLLKTGGGLIVLYLLFTNFKAMARYLSLKSEIAALSYAKSDRLHG